MKLNKETRDSVRIGTVLFDEKDRYTVTDIFDTRYGKQITVKLPDKTMYHHVALSKFYGLEIDNTSDTVTLYDNIYTLLDDKVTEVITAVQGNTTEIDPFYEMVIADKLDDLAEAIHIAIVSAIQTEGR